jgi:hypothetical protein
MRDIENKGNSIIGFDPDPSLRDLDIVKRIGTEKPTNSILIEINKENILQTIDLESFSDRTNRSIKNQLSELLIELKAEERRKIINEIITCINRNINLISEHCNQLTNPTSHKTEESSKFDNLIKLVLES